MLNPKVQIAIISLSIESRPHSTEPRPLHYDQDPDSNGACSKGLPPHIPHPIGRKTIQASMHSSVVRIQNVFGFFTTVAFVVAALIACTDIISPRTPSAKVDVKDIQVYVSHVSPSLHSQLIFLQRKRTSALLFHEKRRIRTHPFFSQRRFLLPLQLEH